MVGIQKPGTEAVMTLRKKIYFIMIATSYFVAMLFALVVAAHAEETTDTAVEQEIIIGPGEHYTKLTSVQPWIVDGEFVGSVASYIYDDVTTERSVDYWELYDQQGDLLAFSWFDQFGIQRIAIDHGIVKDEGKLEGIFVLIIDGELI
jgi:hypothetical protein